MSHLTARAELLARIDVAAICGALEISVGGASHQDVHLFGYLSSMVNTQYGSTPASWGYEFAASATGLPFAEALEYAIDEMARSGELFDSPDGYTPSHATRQKVQTIANGAAFGDRIELIEDVCNVSVLRALPTIARAVRSEPQLARSAEINTVRLIDESELSRTLVQLLLDVRDRLTENYPPSLPAMLWLDIWESERAS